MSNVLNHPMECDIRCARDVGYHDLTIAETMESFPYRYLTETADDHVYEEEEEFWFGYNRFLAEARNPTYTRTIRISFRGGGGEAEIDVPPAVLGS